MLYVIFFTSTIPIISSIFLNWFNLPPMICLGPCSPSQIFYYLICLIPFEYQKMLWELWAEILLHSFPCTTGTTLSAMANHHWWKAFLDKFGVHVHCVGLCTSAMHPEITKRLWLLVIYFCCSCHYCCTHGLTQQDFSQYDFFAFIEVYYIFLKINILF